MAKMRQIKTFETMAVPGTIVKFKTYFYGTETDIHHPDCKLLVKLDIWIVEEGVPTQRFRQKQLNLQYIQRAVVDFEKREIHHKKHGKIEAANLLAVFRVLEEMLST